MEKIMEQLPFKYPVEYAYVKAQNIYLRYLTEEDAKGDWHLWFNSPEVTKYMTARRWFNTPGHQLDYLKYVNTTKDRLALGIVALKTEKLIGVCSLGSIDYINRHAEISSVIGDAVYRNGFYAMEAFALMLEIGFLRLNLHKIFGAGIESNTAAIEISKLMGLKESGRYKEHAFIDGKYHDMIILEIFQRDWLKSNKRPKIVMPQ